MIGETNAVSKNATEKVNIIMTTDQSSHDAIIGAMFTISYGNNTTDYIWQGTAITVEIPAFINYTISFGSVDNYTTPNNITNTSVEGNSRNITATYNIKKETVTVKVTGPSSGYTITVKSESTTIGAQTSSSATYLIAYGTQYTVSASSVTGYTTPSSVTYTANSTSRTITMAYVADEIVNGIYIVNTSGKCYTPSTTNVSNPIGVAVVTDNCCFIMGLSYTGNIPWASSSLTGYNSDISAVPTSTSDSTIATYYDGEAYTTAIIDYFSSETISNCAAAEARSHTITFGGNSLTGYLGSAGEWQAIINNYATVQTAQTNAGGFTIDWDNGTWYWTSCEYNSSGAWVAYFLSSGLYLYANNKYYSYSYYCVVPFYKVSKTDLVLV